MTSNSSKSQQFSTFLQRFFVERLQSQRNASPRTIAAYRDTFRLLLLYAEKMHGKKITTLTLDDFTSELVLSFLDHLEQVRSNSIRSRNLRLAAIRSFARYLSLQFPAELRHLQQILAIPSKRFERPLLGFLTKDEVVELLNAPNPDSHTGRRDRLMLSLLYRTGARVSELITICAKDIDVAGSASVRLHGKGRKQRTVPIPKELGRQIRSWIRDSCLKPDEPLIQNKFGMAMTRSNISERLAIAAKTASKKCATLQNRKVTPHTIRHSTAMHMLQAGIDLTLIALWLGHQSPTTTHGYVEADLAMKERALSCLDSRTSKTKRYRPPESLLQFLNNL